MAAVMTETYHPKREAGYLEKAEKVLKKDLAQRANATGAFSMMNKKGVCVGGDTISCYAPITSWRNPDVFLARPWNKSETTKLKVYQKAWIKWLCNDSIWKDVFVTKTVEEVENLGGGLIDCDHPGPWMQQGAVMWRHTGEHAHKIEEWYNLTQLGFDPLVALALIYNFSFKNNVLTDKSWSGHTAHPYMTGFQYWANCYHGKIQYLPEKLFSESPSYVGVDKIWGTNTQDFYVELGSMWRKHKIPKKVVQDPHEQERVNPFVKAMKNWVPPYLKKKPGNQVLIQMDNKKDAKEMNDLILKKWKSMK